MYWKVIKENFLWLPLLLISIANAIYFLFAVVLQILIRMIDGEPRGEPFSLFFASSVIVMGYGLPVILISDAIGLGLGFLISLFAKKTLPKIIKKVICWFLLFFYLLIIGSFAFLMIRY